MSGVLIVTDAWYPQCNGVVRCLDSLRTELHRRGMGVNLLTPERFWTMPLPTYPEIRLSLARFGAVAELIEAAEPDFIHVATEGPLGLLGRLYCAFSRKAFTTSYHTRFPEYVSARVPVPPDWSYHYLRWFHSAAEATLVPTASIQTELATRGFQHLAPWSRGVDSDVFKPGAKSRFLDLPGPHLLYVGRVSVEKNVRAFLELDLPGSKIVVGDGPQREELERAFPDAHFLGHHSGRELTALYQSADVFVFPSRTDTFGNVITEALACGVPVAAYPVPGPKDILTDPRCGAVNADLGEAVRQALALSREAARAHAARFTWGRCADQFLAALVPAQLQQPRAA